MNGFIFFSSYLPLSTLTSPLESQFPLPWLQDLLSLGLPFEHRRHQGLLVPLHGAETVREFQQGGGTCVRSRGNQPALVLYPETVEGFIADLEENPQKKAHHSQLLELTQTSFIECFPY